MRNIFLEKSCTKYVVEASPRTFSKNSKFSISLDQESEILYSLFFIVCPNQRLLRFINYGVDHLLLPHIKLF